MHGTCLNLFIWLDNKFKLSDISSGVTILLTGMFQQHVETMKHLEQENHTLRDLSLSTSSGTAASGASDADQDVTRKDRDRHVAKELKLLKRTIEEMELRIETQKQTLATRDESIRKLMDMMQAKGWFDCLCRWYYCSRWIFVKFGEYVPLIL